MNVFEFLGDRLGGGGSQDCITAVRWVKENIWSFGGDRTRMGLVGESVGGNLALTTGAYSSNKNFAWFTNCSDAP